MQVSSKFLPLLYKNKKKRGLPLVFQDKQEAFSPSQLPLFHTRT